MLTIFNLINYLIGSPVNITILIMITIALYFYIIKTFWTNITDNIFYVIILVILMLIDLTTIYLIFSLPHECEYIIKSDKKTKKKIKKTNKLLEKNNIKKNNEDILDKNKIIPENKVILEENPKKIIKNDIEIYNDNKSVSLNTY